MDARMRYKCYNVPGGKTTYQSAQDAPEDRLRRHRRGRAMKAVGIAIFIMCPYLYIILLKISMADQLGFIYMTIFGPVILEGIAITLWSKGDSLDAK